MLVKLTTGRSALAKNRFQSHPPTSIGFYPSFTSHLWVRIFFPENYVFRPEIYNFILGRQSGLVVSKFDLRFISCGFESRLIQYTRWKWRQNHARIDFCTQFGFIWKSRKYR
jgi:hypothetical protein